MPDDAAAQWAGVNHLALVTNDMDETVRFYHGVLGMRLVATLSAGPMRHYFFELGPQNTIAFFEWSRAEFQAWANRVAGKFGYRVTFRGVGPDDPEVGPPTQMGVFVR